MLQILGTTGPITDIELDDIYFAGGVPLVTTLVPSKILNGVIISWATAEGKSYTVQRTNDLPTTIDWFGFFSAIEGEGTTQSVFDPIEASGPIFYRILQNP